METQAVVRTNSTSDIDLFILSQEPEEIKKIIASIKTRQKIQSVIKAPSELADFNGGVDNLSAQYNWWGTATPVDADVFTGDDMDYVPLLTSDPN